ncbi:hypothetical protein HPB47_010059 [Ixodes persulcatus]|uniref:Uncharacterized protein n=1 Tax=Ixodes persulcatus TaxID=34615 RepID=A0AC60P041_IXOPE|nr:hypothetical protein HPB47_010059 [Ixodes persulcatus]
MTAFLQKSNPHEQNVKTAEIKMSAFVAEHALSFKAMDHLGELAKVVFRDSAIAKGSKDSLIAVIQEESQRLLRCLCQNFMKPSSIEDPAKLNPLNPRSLLALEELYVGAGCQGSQYPWVTVDIVFLPFFWQ